MHRAFRVLANFLERPEIQALLGLCLVISGGMEIVADLTEGSSEPGVHHGVALFGTAHTLRQIPELAEGLSKLLWGAEVAGESESGGG